MACLAGADLWPMPDEDEFGELAAALEAAEDALESGADIAARPGPLAAALQRRNGAGAGAPETEDPSENPPEEDKRAPYDDPPEAHYDAAPLTVTRTGPDLQKGDDDAIDAEENGWIYALRCGHDPIDPCSAEEMATWAENEARLAANPSGIAFPALAPAESASAEHHDGT